MILNKFGNNFYGIQVFEAQTCTMPAIAYFVINIPSTKS